MPGILETRKANYRAYHANVAAVKAQSAGRYRFCSVGGAPKRVWAKKIKEDEVTSDDDGDEGPSGDDGDEGDDHRRLGRYGSAARRVLTDALVGGGPAGGGMGDAVGAVQAASVQVVPVEDEPARAQPTPAVPVRTRSARVLVIRTRTVRVRTVRAVAVAGGGTGGTVGVAPGGTVSTALGGTVSVAPGGTVGTALGGTVSVAPGGTVGTALGGAGGVAPGGVGGAGPAGANRGGRPPMQVGVLTSNTSLNVYAKESRQRPDGPQRRYTFHYRGSNGRERTVKISEITYTHPFHTNGLVDLQLSRFIGSEVRKAFDARG